MAAPRRCFCGIEWGYRHVCESPKCPVRGLVPGTDEAERAIVKWRSRPSVAQSRCLAGDAAIEVLERRAWLDRTAVRTELLDLELGER